MCGMSGPCLGCLGEYDIEGTLATGAYRCNSFEKKDGEHPGAVYLLKFGRRDSEDCKLHPALLIDLYGDSYDAYLNGFLCELNEVNASETKQAHCEPKMYRFKVDKNDRHIRHCEQIGSIDMKLLTDVISTHHQDRETDIGALYSAQSELHILSRDTFKDLVKEKGDQISVDVNSHQFVRRLAERLGCSALNNNLDEFQSTKESQEFAIQEAKHIRYEYYKKHGYLHTPADDVLLGLCLVVFSPFLLFGYLGLQSKKLVSWAKKKFKRQPVSGL